MKIPTFQNIWEEMMESFLHLKGILPVTAWNAGYFKSRGLGTHADRTIDSFEIIYVNSGTLGIYEEGKKFEVPKGHALILFPGRHHWGSRQFEKDLTFYWIHFQIDKKSEAGDDMMSLPQLVRLAKPEQFVELFRRFILRQERCSEDRTVLNLILLEILCELSDSAYPLEISTTKVVLANQADQYIRLHLNETLSSNLIAEALSCNPDYLGRIYHEIYNKTLTEAIHTYRLNKASRLLIETSANVNEIADLCGYPDADYFRKNFKKYRGMTPKEYRQTYCLISTDIEE